MKRVTRYMFMLIVAVVATLEVAAQEKYPLYNKHIYYGNKAYEQGNNKLAIEKYKEAIAAQESMPYEAIYNMANAYIKIDSLERAIPLLNACAIDSTRSVDERANAYYNLGQAYFKNRQLPEAMESFRNTLKLDNTDEEALYNYVYVKALIENQKQQNQDNRSQNNNQNRDNNQNQQNNQGQQNNQSQNDQNKDDKKDNQNNQGQNDQNKDDKKDNQNNQGQNDQNKDDKKDNQNNQDQNDQNKDDKKDNQNKQDQNDQNKDDKKDESQGESEPNDKEQDARDNSPQNTRDKMTEKQMEQILNAIQDQENKTQEKLGEQNKKKRGVMPGKKNW